MTATNPWPIGGGETGRQIRTVDWSATPLGPLSQWPKSLKTAVDICLASPEAVSVLWGPHFHQIYNDAYARIVAQDRHPPIFGQPALENWAEARELVQPLLEQVLADGTPALLTDQLVPLYRGESEVPEERYFTFSFSAIRDDSGRVAGIFHHVNETTAVIRKRDARFRTLFNLMAEAYSVIEMLFDADGTPVDYRFVELNPAFEEMTGLKDVIGKTVREAVPEMESEWITRFGEVARTGEPVRFNGYISGLGDRWYDGYAFRVGEDESRLVAIVFSEITERRRAEEALRASEKMLTLIYDNSPDCLYLVKVEPEGVYRFISVNAAFLRISGYTYEQVINAPMEKVVPANNVVMVRGHYEEAFRTRQPVTYEELAQLPNGTKYAEITLTPIFASDGTPKNIVGVIRDMTERRHAELALRESEERFRTLSDVVPQVIWTNDASGAITYYNRRWYEYTGFPLDESRDAGWRKAIHPEDVAAAEERWWDAAAQERVFEIEYRLRRSDGVYRWHIARSAPFKDQRGRIVSWCGSATDIEDLKQAEAARRELEERFRLLVEGARDYAMYLKDARDRIIFWSAGAERLFGWTEAEVLGKLPHLLFTPEALARGEPENEMAEARRTGQATDRRWHVRKDGSLFWTDGLLMRLDDEHGNLRGYAKVTRDATQQKRAEDELRASEEAIRRANEELEQRVEERTEELFRVSEMRQELLRRLVTAQEEERGRISRDLHDDTGQHVTALLLGLSHLETTATVCDDPEAQEMLRRLQAHAGEVAKKSHRLSFTLRPTALDDIGLLGALQNYASEWSGWSGIPVDLEGIGLEKPDGGLLRLPPEIETTIYRVTQEALTNVLRHAVSVPNGSEPKKRGATEVTILVQRKTREVLTIIEDDGPGFDVEAALNLPPGKRRVGIFGMQERARLAGGTVTVESEPGRGTTVFLRLPLPEEAPALK